ncbi:MAG: 16S rRNA (guanine(527)-N(7))-methyltransferase RsmG [Bacteroidales bacterium]|nr:16S rRNA (guanine(527)-N(7))-methyltransferase RsmG [Bacteroidales bacterium]
MHSLLDKYFSLLNPEIKEKLFALEEAYSFWNSKVNLVSRRDMDNFFLHHIIHSLSLLKFIEPGNGTRILDAGTGGGLPGIPLAIALPSCSFTLVDSTRKKIRVVESIIKDLSIANASAKWSRVEELDPGYNIIVSRAVAPFPDIVKWTRKLLVQDKNTGITSGIFSLKGGNLSTELSELPSCRTYELKDVLEEDYFKEKKIVWLPFSTIQ